MCTFKKKGGRRKGDGGKEKKRKENILSNGSLVKAQVYLTWRMFNHRSDTKSSEIPATWSASKTLMQSTPELYRTTSKHVLSWRHESFQPKGHTVKKTTI